MSHFRQSFALVLATQNKQEKIHKNIQKNPQNLGKKNVQIEKRANKHQKSPKLNQNHQVLELFMVWCVLLHITDTVGTGVADSNYF